MIALIMGLALALFGLGCLWHARRLCEEAALWAAVAEATERQAVNHVSEATALLEAIQAAKRGASFVQRKGVA